MCMFQVTEEQVNSFNLMLNDIATKDVFVYMFEGTLFRFFLLAIYNPISYTN